MNLIKFLFNKSNKSDNVIDYKKLTKYKFGEQNNSYKNYGKDELKHDMLIYSKQINGSSKGSSYLDLLMIFSNKN
jgi:hypothetical protein